MNSATALMTSHTTEGQSVATGYQRDFVDFGQFDTGCAEDNILL
jgi:hypothetical protein